MLNFARSKRVQDTTSSQETTYGSNENHYAPAPSNYPYYPSINGAPPQAMYYPPPAPPMPNGNQRQNHLPPPEVASNIPCRFFPACRYGASCLFLHPQGPPGGYYAPPGGVPQPGTYPGSYEQHPPQPYYYPVPPSSFSGAMNGQSPQQGPPMPMLPPSEMMPPFSPTGAPAMPYGPSQMMYPPNGQTLPMPISSLGPTPQSPPAGFNPSSPTAANGFVVQPSGHASMYPQANGHASAIYPDANGSLVKSPRLDAQSDAAGPRQDGFANRRGTGARRGTFPRSKPVPACMFFPLGKCKNGDDCRFPHIIPQDGIPSASFHLRGGGPRAPRGGHANGNGYSALDEKLGNLSLNGHSGSSFRGRGGRGALNGYANKRASFPMKQRVPNADEFPVLGGGATTPPIRANGGLVNGNGPTAAQVLQAPRPVRTNSYQAPSPRATTPERIQEVNGVATEVVPAIPSFAAVATANVDVAVAA
ncbi:Glycerol-3-phosphate dehydrogenase [NAD(+)] [Mycena kentingensis (nom. inval.)]|nr:Glycerol-3-phosphate dehydrogenase [NAD(+)] [Mycena kentingensis (nom. inval.)]